MMAVFDLERPAHKVLDSEGSFLLGACGSQGGFGDSLSHHE